MYYEDLYHFLEPQHHGMVTETEAEHEGKVQNNELCGARDGT